MAQRGDLTSAPSAVLSSVLCFWAKPYLPISKPAGQRTSLVSTAAISRQRTLTFSTQTFSPMAVASS